MVCTFLNNWRETKEEGYFVTLKNNIKLRGLEHSGRVLTLHKIDLGLIPNLIWYLIWSPNCAGSK